MEYDCDQAFPLFSPCPGRQHPRDFRKRNEKERGKDKSPVWQLGMVLLPCSNRSKVSRTVSLCRKLGGWPLQWIGVRVSPGPPALCCKYKQQRNSWQILLESREADGQDALWLSFTRLPWSMQYHYASSHSAHVVICKEGPPVAFQERWHMEG